MTDNMFAVQSFGGAAAICESGNGRRSSARVQPWPWPGSVVASRTSK
eukprot:CAMPEP_0202039610 /NCGR_PEP_ID=MMETSP0962-20130828/17120_1 /ASSEMBLY_ACC=CAM_ASM_000488 /TAXON_ID=4773 /ORGANISM="Schizochytrium aggregatum, Strain ATCC28209" /LENGTH=46 /DNA_ID= /DNA_START= /DNA_END= /DNA_ORIENTATION=